ncbi:hypothetical protein GLYMA_12G042702v4 [Glycine max]|uniref:probable pinoresinol-lariciresinol reductase 3 isoform X2 n=1 Tax=Glycine soja TaxID=3848 RepID=UPI00103FAFAD|nr:probable pinoresinol-lariciresinol reductase 3 isoform X2 [Glycine soja]KAG4385158.1 hypothetical protein GLYMA_12G042702v4 [Glycine max]KAG4385160.1 hypothetical protein GLYMA_12G042702v4 [Glycine max]KAG4385161.1 hypothetical protein GLYMA_12G042702v4 [Glycine max]KAH1141526.1 hypothetical protein GYH30_032664 [Glycine max]KAH1141528.1 hypothetical protein GYH30_032664 [Glycine max]
MEKSKILVIGATGNLGYDLAEANLKFCHPTFALVGDSAFSDPIKAQELPFSKVRWKMTEAVRLVDVVICSVSARETLHQKLLIRFIKQVGSIKRFIHLNLGEILPGFEYLCLKMAIISMHPKLKLVDLWRLKAFLTLSSHAISL